MLCIRIGFIGDLFIFRVHPLYYRYSNDDRSGSRLDLLKRRPLKNLSKIGQINCNYILTLGSDSLTNHYRSTIPFACSHVSNRYYFYWSYGTTKVLFNSSDRWTLWGRRWPTNWMKRKDRSRSFSRHSRYGFFCIRTSPFRQYIRHISLENNLGYLCSSCYWY